MLPIDKAHVRLILAGTRKVSDWRAIMAISEEERRVAEANREYQEMLELDEELEGVEERIREFSSDGCSAPLIMPSDPVEWATLRDLYRQRRGIRRKLAEIMIPYYDGCK